MKNILATTIVVDIFTIVVVKNGVRRRIMKFTALVAFFFFASLMVAQENHPLTIDDYIVRGNYLKALDQLKMKMEKDSAVSDDYRKMGRIFQEMGLHEKAIKCFDKVLAEKTIDFAVQFFLCQSLIKSNRYDRAEKELLTIRQNDQSNIKAMLLLSDLYMQIKNYRKARSVYFELLDFEMAKTMALAGIGKCELQLNNLEKALDYLEEAYRSDPTNLKLMFLLVKGYQIGGSYSLANQLLQDELTKYPDNQQLLAEYAYSLFHNEEFQKALKIYEQVDEAWLPAWEKQQRMGICYYYLDKPRYAELMLANSRQQDSTNYITPYYLAFSQMELEKYVSANKFFDETIKLSTPSFMAEVYIRKAICCENEQDYDASMANYKRAVHFAPDRTDIHYYIANLVDKHYKDIKLAIEKFEYFLEHSEGCDAAMVDYAEMRLDELEEKKIFQH
ncbi:MAG: tetratricopeptide repeat protein [Bacteroidota bacterium]